MTWNSTYQTNKRVWGNKPSELASFACDYLREVRAQYDNIEILDVGCGYGRDASYLAQSVNCNVLGIDNANEAIEMARKGLVVELKSRVRFRCRNFKQVIGHKFEVVFVSNLYQLLDIEDRSTFRDMIKRSLKRNGMFFLSTLSTSDPEHFGKGERIKNESNSFRDEKFLHFCTREEIEKDFSFLSIKKLNEHEYYESRSNGQTHHHISWMLLGVNQYHSNLPTASHCRISQGAQK